MEQGLAERLAHGPQTTPFLALVVLAVLGLGGCEETPSTTPWPTSEVEARRLVASSGRSERRGDPLSSAGIVAALDAAADDETLVVGWDAIAESLAAHRVVLFGVHHDARGQHEAFRRLFGPSGVPRALAFELFDADGAWGGESQVGDDGALRRYVDTGEGLDDLRARLARGAYTAWKYELVDEILSSVVAARAAGQPALGCDVPPVLSRTLRPWDEGLRLRVRELHCARALERREGPVALLIGDAHLGSTGLPRFLDATAVHAVGGRASDAGIEAELDVKLVDPVLVGLGPRRFVLLLPGPHLGLEVERSRARESRPGVRVEVPDGVRVHDGPGWLVMASEGRRWVVGVPVEEDQGADIILLDPDHIDIRFFATQAEPPGSTR